MTPWPIVVLIVACLELGAITQALAFTNVVILADSPATLASALKAQGVMKDDGKGGLIGALEGVEYVKVPNPIIVTPAVVDKNGRVTTPAVMDTRIAYLVKLVRSAETDQVAGKAQTNPDGSLKDIASRTKLGAFILANSTVDKTNGVNSYKWNGGNIWLVTDTDAAQFGAWQ